MKRLVLATILFLLFIGFVLPTVSQNSEQHMGQTNLPDSRLYYTIDDVYSIANHLGETGRAYYVRQRITFDLIWPIIYFWFFYTAIMVTFMHFDPKTIYSTVRWFPVLALVFDYVENGLASLVMMTYPSRIDALARWLPYSSLLKWTFIGLSFVSLVLGILIRFIRYSRKKEKEKWAKENQE